MGHSVTIFCPHTEYRNELEILGIVVHETRQLHKVCRKTIKQLRRFLLAGHYDIIYAINSKAIPSAAFASVGYPAKLVCYRGTVSGLYRHDPTSYLTILNPRVDAVICVSQAVSDYVEKKVWRKTVKIETIYKGHQLKWYNEKAANLSEFDIPNNAFVAIAVARFRPTKGLLVLLEALNLIAHLENLHVLIVGNGTDAKVYKTALANHQMRTRIHVTGHRNDATKLIAASDVLVQASTRGEGLPRSIVESLGHGVPVISTTTGGAKEILEDEVSGYLVPTHDSPAIAQKLSYLYDNPKTTSAMSDNCRAIVRTTLSSEITAQKHIKFFHSLLDHQALPRDDQNN